MYCSSDFSSRGILLGTITLCYIHAPIQGNEDAEALKSAAHVCAIAIEHKRSREALEVYAEELDLMFYLSQSSVIVLNTDFRIKRLNRSFSELFGITEQEAIGKFCFDTIISRGVTQKNVLLNASLTMNRL